MPATRPAPVGPRGLTRRTFLKGSIAATAAVAGGGLWTTAIQPRRARAAETPIEHVVISMMENRSFDHYFGYAPQVQAAGFGPPAGYSQPNPNPAPGTTDPQEPYRFFDLGTPDIPHDWDAVHGQYDGGAMDGFMTHSGIWAMGYYTAQELPFYYSLLGDSTLCANFFCSLLGPTWPNRFYLMSGTSGGITTNGLWGYGIFDYPMILDLLDAGGVTWKTYNLGMDSVPYGNTDNVAVFWKNFAKDQRTNGSKGGFLNDCRKGRLPQVSFLIPSYARGWDEHPPASVQVGESLMAECVTALRESPQWDSSAFLITYDEHGGYFDHVEPPRLDAFGLGIRVPCWVISPYAKPGHLEPTLYEFASILKFLEHNFDLPTLASVNHRFDAGTPVGGNYQAAAPGATAGPPAPPRDGIAAIGDLTECFTF
jgi:phospholipase C